MESLVRAGFSRHLNPGCLWYGSVSCLISQPFPHGAVGSEYCALEDGAPVGRMAPLAGNGSICLPLPSQDI